MAIPSMLLPAIFAYLFASLTVSETLIFPIDYQTPSSCSDQSSQKSLACEVEEAKLKIAQLETILDERIAATYTKIQYFRDCEKKIEGLTAEIDRLKTAMSSSEHDYSRACLKLTALEEEVRLLWAASRKNNFEIHDLEYKALDAESRFKEVNSQVEEMTEIVSEQWIQIQQLEQAVHMAEMRKSKVKKELWRRCPFVKFFINLFGDCLEALKGIMDPYVSREGSMFVFCKSRALQTFDAAKHYHHQLQGFITHAMKSNELTATLVHEEVVFFMVGVSVGRFSINECLRVTPIPA
ncbi:hypothetical protein PHJA_002270700 [Phtheirospermum japonicum]|uniref:Uncharacterized protein n=1 Tax=Phtheirospermum japonicum TaxID=374723 RepID=A0A830CKS9_9LAMI|nr:hypothetical protein PHJA_002270700 [Phtheirospermum japonicum]